MYYSTGEFYRSKDWEQLREYIITKRTNECGEVICAECGKPILKRYDCIAHHVKEITLDNLNDCNITLNENNIELLHARCHNLRHARFGFSSYKKVFLIYGCPLSGKSTYVNSIAGMNDLIVDINNIFKAISNNDLNNKPNSLYETARAVQDCLLEQIKLRRGKWQTAYIIGTYAYKGERERLLAEYGAEGLFIECDKETALNRLASCQDGRDLKATEKYINDWFIKYSA